FRRGNLPEALTGARRWNGALILDVNRDERSDMLLLPHGEPPLLLQHEPVGGGVGPDKWFRPGTVESPPLLHAHAIAMDLDGRTDVVGLSNRRRPVLLQNDSGRLVRLTAGLGAEESWPKDLLAVAVADLDGNCRPDVLAWSEESGLWVAFQKEIAHQG